MGKKFTLEEIQEIITNDILDDYGSGRSLDEASASHIDGHIYVKGLLDVTEIAYVVLELLERAEG